MITYSEAISLINKISIKLSDESTSILKALNRVTSEDILSPSKNPSANNSAFDGFAVLTEETKGLTKKNKKKFKILKTIAAGDNPRLDNYEKNSTAEVMTGGLVPEQFDSIIPVEKANYFPSKEKATHIIVDEEVEQYSYIRFAGEDYNLKDVVLKKGEIIKSKHIMVFTALGIKEIKVKKQPKIIFFGTGNEIVDYKETNIPAWKVRNSNNNYFTLFGKNLHCQVVDGGVIKDNEPEKLERALSEAINSDIDLFVTSGAVSAGKFDFIPNLIKDLGFETHFKGVAIKPGKPILLSQFKQKEKLFFGLPGNPISLAVGLRFFIYPLIRNALGMSKEKQFRAKLKNEYNKMKNSSHFTRCSMTIDDKGFSNVEVLQGQQSNRMKSFVNANCWGIFNEGKEKFIPGDFVEWVPLIPSG
jgi:molybdopterin molybdotransferase